MLDASMILQQDLMKKY